ncbi:MAG TPA: IucA/IucC family protein [Catenuloplanes sp.]|jgi:siderophore synthetase component
MHHPVPDPVQTRAALAEHHPHLVAGYDAALPGATGSVLARLWGALNREPVTGIATRGRSGERRTLTLADGRRVSGPADAARPFADAPARLSVDLDGRAHTDPAALLGALDLPGDTARLAGEVANSVANLALARAAQPAPHGGAPTLRTLTARGGDTLATVEQYVVDGHPLHPCCRTRAGMSAAEVLAYGPEHRPLVDLLTYRVPPGRWHGTAEPLLLVHPWQREHLLDAYPWLTDTGARHRARPLMSLRTLAPVDGGPHVKTAVDVQMTSAVRTVSPAAVHNGPRLSALLGALTADLASTLCVLPETAAGAVLVDGTPSRHLAHLVRQRPRLYPGELAVPLAALCAPSPADGRPLLTEATTQAYAGDPVAFLSDLVRVVLPPLLVLLHRGVALEAHGQNTLVVLRDGRPTRLLYRDLGGVRVSDRRLRAHGVDPPRLHGDLSTDDPAELRTTLAAAVGCALGEVLATQTRCYGVEPARLWAVVAARVRDTYADLPAACGDAAVLLGATMPVKATTAMRLAADPLTPRWARLTNPLAVAA